MPTPITAAGRAAGEPLRAALAMGPAGANLCQSPACRMAAVLWKPGGKGWGTQALVPVEDAFWGPGAEPALLLRGAGPSTPCSPGQGDPPAAAGSGMNFPLWPNFPRPRHPLR